jgi:hypothetical protein
VKPVGYSPLQVSKRPAPTAEKSSACRLALTYSASSADRQRRQTTSLAHRIFCLLLQGEYTMYKSSMYDPQPSEPLSCRILRVGASLILHLHAYDDWIDKYVNNHTSNHVHTFFSLLFFFFFFFVSLMFFGARQDNQPVNISLVQPCRPTRQSLIY